MRHVIWTPNPEDKWYSYLTATPSRDYGGPWVTFPAPTPLRSRAVYADADAIMTQVNYRVERKKQVSSLMLLGRIAMDTKEMSYWNEVMDLDDTIRQHHYYHLRKVEPEEFDNSDDEYAATETTVQACLDESSGDEYVQYSKKSMKRRRRQ